MNLDLLIIFALFSIKGQTTTGDNESWINVKNNTNHENVYKHILQCQVKKFPNVAPSGAAAINCIWPIGSESHCISLCWIYKLHGQNCNSVSYDKIEKLCKLFDEANEPGITIPAMEVNYDYIIVEKCLGVAEKPPTESPATEAPPRPEPLTEEPQTEAPPAEPQTTEGPPETEAPATETPSSEAPQTEQPETEPPPIETLHTEPPTEEPQTEPPVAVLESEAPPIEPAWTEEPPHTEPPAIEINTEPPHTEEPVTEAPSFPVTTVPLGSTFSGTCGQTAFDPFRRRIVGGEVARPHSIPWIISLRKKGYWHACGGTLIRVNQKDESDIAITAAHCVGDGEANFDVAAGAHLKNETADGEVRVPASQVVIHPDYNKPVRVSNDIAIIKLSRPIKFSQTIQPACLPAKGERLPDDTEGLVAGWGKLSETESSPNALNRVIVPIISHEKCTTKYNDRLVEETMMCGGYDEGGKDSCQGDSGGPYLFKGSNGYTLQGVVSWGLGCARPGAPGVYARVSTYIDWIQEQIRTLSEVRV